MDLEEIYNQKHQKGLERIISENEFIDENLNNENDTRRGIQLLIRPSEREISFKLPQASNALIPM